MCYSSLTFFPQFSHTLPDSFSDQSTGTFDHLKGIRPGLPIAILRRQRAICFHSHFSDINWGFVLAFLSSLHEKMFSEETYQTIGF